MNNLSETNLVAPYRFAGLLALSVDKAITFLTPLSIQLSIKLVAPIIFDVTKDESRKIPYEVVATYKNNEVKPFVFPNIVAQTCKAYNEAHILVEVNDLGQSI